MRITTASAVLLDSEYGVKSDDFVKNVSELNFKRSLQEDR